MKHLVQFSTGVGSAEVAFRMVERYGVENVALLTTDTRREDGDNWRFAHEIVDSIGPVEWVILADGRTPMQAGRDARMIPNNRVTTCSRVLKIELMRAWIEAHYSPDECVLSLGLDWSEEHRIDGRMIKGEYHPGTRERWLPFVTEYPLTDPPLVAKAQLLDAMRSRGIEPPRLYATGAPHANCGGACVRAGQAEWERLLRWNRPRFLSWEAEENESRELLGDVSILKDRRGGTTKPLSLTAFREQLERDPTLFDADDEGACACV